MSFATHYINRNIQQSAFINEPVKSGLGMVVVIPACREPELLGTINSLYNCISPSCQVEVIVVVNESELSSAEVRRQNDESVIQLHEWKQQHVDAFLQLRAIRPQPFPKKHAGAGLARKTGMDEAIRRFHQVDNPKGILVSLDADTLVDSNYLVEIETCFNSAVHPVGATIKFKHRLSEITDERHLAGMQLYEKYLHYYKRALAFTGYPNAIYTIGSAFAVRADAYVKQGGMSKRQAGEDFYFLHKLTQLGQVTELNSTCVYPSARLSDRVPFGTGPVLRKWVDGDNKLQETYCFQAFIDLKQFIKLLPWFFESKIDSTDLRSLPVSASLQQFLEEDQFTKSLSEIKKNSSSFLTFTKRFYNYFNAFKILKFLNHSHSGYYRFQDLNEADKALKAAENTFYS